MILKIRARTEASPAVRSAGIRAAAANQHDGFTTTAKASTRGQDWPVAGELMDGLRFGSNWLAVIMGSVKKESAHAMERARPTPTPTPPELEPHPLHPLLPRVPRGATRRQASDACQRVPTPVEEH